MSNIAAANPHDTEVGEESASAARATPEISGVGIPAGLLTRTGNGASCEVDTSEQIAALLNRVNLLVPDRATSFCPKEPRSIAATGLTSEEVEKLVLKLLNARGSASGRRISSHLCLPLSIIEDIIRHLRDEQLVALKGAAEAGDYDYVLRRQRSYTCRGILARFDVLWCSPGLPFGLPERNGRSKHRRPGSHRH
jgi:hypothetical protein